MKTKKTRLLLNTHRFSLKMTCSVLVISLLFGFQIKAQQNTDSYGVDEANSKFKLANNVLGGNENFDYLNLKDHPAASGVPLGGIGAGNINLSPNGRFTRIGINNIHQPIKRTKSSFFALWVDDGSTKQTRRLVKDNEMQYGMKGIEHSYYKGLFPMANLKFDMGDMAVNPNITAYSGLIPHNVKDSSLPMAWFDVELEGLKDADVSVAFSWEDILGIIRDPKSLEGMDGQLLSNNRAKLCNGEKWPDMERPETRVMPYNRGKMSGFLQFTPNPILPLKWTFQNYVDHLAVVVEKSNNQKVSVLSSYSPLEGADAWAEFTEKGEFNTHAGETLLTPLKGGSKVSVLCVKTNIKKGEKKKIRFALVWYCPEVKIKSTPAAGSYWPNGSDYNKYFHNYFKNIDGLVDYAFANRDRIKAQTEEWQQPILNSTLPDWYKFKLINSAYVIYTNMVLTKKGDVMVNEGAMGGLGGTMDQRISSHPFYQKFFTQIDRSEMNIFADAQDPQGFITHFIGHYYVGMSTVGGVNPTQRGTMVDNCSGWFIQLMKDYDQTGDMGYLKPQIERVKSVMAYLLECRPAGSEIPKGFTTYDDFQHPPLYSYYAGVWLTTLRAYKEFGEVIGDKNIVSEAITLFDKSQKEIISKLWNGRFFSYGSNTDGSNPADTILFTGQLAGQFLSRYCGWGDIYPMEMVKASMVSQFKISLSKTPDYYANKVWNIPLNKGIDNPGSQCWPFYLESYTAYTGMQAGFYEDAMDVMRHIQLVHLRKGWTWTQNLWNPNEVTYMTAPVSWFSTDILAGAGINIPRKEFRIAPILDGNTKQVFPLYYPTFWANLTLDPTTKTILLKITKTFGKNNSNQINKIISEPAGLASSERKVIQIKEFNIKNGNVLDLSTYWDVIMRSKLEKSVLKNAQMTEFREVKNRNY